MNESSSDYGTRTLEDKNKPIQILKKIAFSNESPNHGPIKESMNAKFQIQDFPTGYINAPKAPDNLNYYNALDIPNSKGSSFSQKTQNPFGASHMSNPESPNQKSKSTSQYTTNIVRKGEQEPYFKDDLPMEHNIIFVKFDIQTYKQMASVNVISIPVIQAENKGSFFQPKIEDKHISTKLFDEIPLISNPIKGLNCEEVLVDKDIDGGTISIPTSKIPSQLNIRPSGELIKCLSDFISCLIPITDINKVLLEQDKIINKVNKIASLGCEEAHKFSNFLNSLQCSKCKNKNIKIQLSCSHIFCSSCISTLKISQSENSDFYTLSCSVCDQKITKSEQNLLFPPYDRTFLEMEKSYLYDKLISKSSLKCKKCFKDKQKYYIPSCYHMCKDCVAEQIRSNIIQCSICNVSYDNIHEILHEKNNCDCCNRETFFIGDFMRAIEDEKCSLCSICLSQAYNQGKCPKCESRITKKEKFEICDFLFAICEICMNEVYKGYLKVASCCRKKVCTNCLENDEVCKSCLYMIGMQGLIT